MNTALQSFLANEKLPLTTLRVVVAILLAIHGWSRFLAEAVAPFGTWLAEQGLLAGLVIAIVITALEILATPILALGILVRPLCAIFAIIYAVGAVMVHAPAGWFVVGLGRNGMEYSVLLIVCLMVIALGHQPRKKKAI